MMRTPDKNLAFLYFENDSLAPSLQGFTPDSEYMLRWFDPVTGQWKEERALTADADGTLHVPDFPTSDARPTNDWAAKLIAR
jgi:hypothetical protein